MSYIIKQRRGKKLYYYLEQSVRIGTKVQKKRLYLGSEVPKSIEKLREKFGREKYEQEWYPTLDRIKEGYSAELKRMPKEARDKALEVFMIAFTYDTQRIEGSTLSFKDTAQVLIDQTAPPGVLIRDIKETESHRKVFYEMIGYEGDLSLSTVLKWHRELFAETKGRIAGNIRDYNVMIKGSKSVLPSHVYMESMLGNFFEWYRANKNVVHPVILSALVHLKFVTIHPFGDGNGRISRLIMNFVLNRNGFPMLNIKYRGRMGYYNALERSQTTGKDDPFLIWFLKSYVKQHKQYLSN